MSRIIALAGPAQSGKSSAASYLGSLGFIEDSFAAPIRDFISDILDINLEQLEICKDQNVPPFACTPRKMMQTLGTEWGRQMIQDDLWIMALLERLQNRQPTQSFVISDLRFENEARVLRDMGAEIWHIERPGSEIAETYHESENGITQQLHDFVLINDGTKEKFRIEIERFLGW